MTDEQAIAGALIAAAGAIAGAIKWAAGRIAKSTDASAETTKLVTNRNTDAMIANTASNAILATKIDTIADFVQRRPETATDGVPRPVEEVTTVTTTRRTPPKGSPVGGYYGPSRPSTHGGDR